jgi:hypothetical protein
LIFLIKTCLFLCFENALKKFENFLFFSLIQINIFNVFVLFWCDDIKKSILIYFLLLNFFFHMVKSRGDHFRFGSVFIKKSNQTEIFFLKKKPKPVQTGLARFFRFGLVFLVWLGFFSGFVLFRFGSVFLVFCL